MKQQGSKYDAAFKEQAIALVASGVSITNAAVRLRIPKSTLADWVHTQWDADEDAVSALMGLGFTRSESVRAVKRAHDAGARTTEEVIMKALQSGV